MRTLLALLAVALVGGGFYVHQNPQAFDDIKGQVGLRGATNTAPKSETVAGARFSCAAREKDGGGFNGKGFIDLVRSDLDPALTECIPPKTPPTPPTPSATPFLIVDGADCRAKGGYYYVRNAYPYTLPLCAFPASSSADCPPGTSFREVGADGGVGPAPPYSPYCVTGFAKAGP